MAIVMRPIKITSLQKSMVYFSANTPVEVCQDLCSILNMPQVDDPGKYLGILTNWGSSPLYVLSTMFYNIDTRIVSKT